MHNKDGKLKIKCATLMYIYIYIYQCFSKRNFFLFLTMNIFILTSESNIEALMVSVLQRFSLSLNLLQRRLLYRLPRTTRGSRPLNINHPHSDSSSHHSSYLGLTDHLHLQLIYTHTYTHTYKPHTHTDSLRSLDLPRLSFLSVIV